MFPGGEGKATFVTKVGNIFCIGCREVGVVVGHFMRVDQSQAILSEAEKRLNLRSRI